VIRRLLLFVALLALGFAALWWARGDAAFSAARSAEAAPAREPQRGGIDVRPQADGPTLTFSIEGEFAVEPTREIALADGTRLLLPKYSLHARDSRARPEADNLMELSDVTVTLYRLVRGAPPAEPSAERSGMLRAKSVLVEIERDARGRPTIHEDREMEFTDATFGTLPGAGGTPMSLAVARARLRTTEKGSVLRTAPDEPFTLRIEGDQPAMVTGKGLLATVPGGEADGPVEVRVLAEPRLHSDDGRTAIAARGTLAFTEQPDGSGLLVLRDGVTVDLAQSGGGVRARGDELRAGLRRTRSADGDAGALWHWLVLHGAPALLDAREARLECRRIDVVADAGGGIARLTASGSPFATIETDGRRSLLRSEQRIHLVPIADVLHPWIGPLGFPRGALGPRFDRILSCAGSSTVDAAADGGPVALAASRGMLLVRGTGSAASLRADGSVRATLPGDGGTLESEDGLVLHESAGARQVVLGLHAGQPSRFAVRRGGTLAIEGHGRCELHQTTEATGATAAVTLRSPSEDGVVTVPQGTLRGIGELTARLDGERVSRIVATGARCLLEGSLREGEAVGEATRIESDDGRRFFLHGAPARVRAGDRGETFGDVVELTAEGDAGTVRARGGAGMRASLARRDGPPLAIDLDGDLVEVLPGLAPAAPLRWHASFLPAPARVVFAADWRTRVVHVRGAARFTSEDPADSAARHDGEGDELWLTLAEGGGRGLLVGEPATVRVAGPEQIVHGRGRRIALAQEGGELRAKLLPGRSGEASVRLNAAPRQRGDGDGLAVRELTVYCRGSVAVEARQVAFLGPVRVLGDEAEGSPPSLTVLADGLTMARDAAGAVTDVVATGDVRFSSPRVTGGAHALRLDLRHQVAELNGGRRGVAFAEVDGARMTGHHVELDYTTYAVRVWYGDAQTAREVR